MLTFDVLIAGSGLAGMTLALHLAEVGLIGLSVIIFATSFTGITDEHAIGKAFTEALPFTALLTVFFAVVVGFLGVHHAYFPEILRIVAILRSPAKRSSTLLSRRAVSAFSLPLAPTMPSGHHRFWA